MSGIDARPRFSVLMSVYAGDRAEWLDEALASVVGQSLRPDEVVLVEDGPVGEALGAVVAGWERREPGLLVVVRLGRNQGLGVALREGMRRVRNELVARMDSDDVCEPGRFEGQAAFMARHPEVDVLGGQIAEFRDETGEPAGSRIVPCADADVKAYMRRRCPFNHTTVMLRRGAVERAGGYRSWPQNEDYDLWVRMAESGAVFANLPETLVSVRVGRGMYARRGGLRYFRSELGIQREMLSLGLIGPARFVVNVAARFVVQIAIPDSLRGLVYSKLARSYSRQKRDARRRVP